MNIENYLKPGNLLSIGFDMPAKRMLSYEVKSYVEKPKEDDVTLDVAGLRETA